VRTFRARCRRTLGRFADAEADLLAAVDYYREHAPSDVGFGAVAKALASLYEQWQRPEDGALWTARHDEWREEQDRRWAAR
jgi:hypothetical protein